VNGLTRRSRADHDEIEHAERRRNGSGTSSAQAAWENENKG
jgi:hypothetical protein